MGVRGLTRYCAQHQAATSEVCEDLYDVTLAVDFVGFLYHVCELVFDEAQAKSAISPRAWLLLGGCPDRLERHVTRWLKKLREHHISLLFVTDPPQCFGGEDHRKGVCLADRAEEKTERIQELGSTLFAQDPVTKQLRLTNDEQQVQTSTPVLKHVNGLFPFAREKLRAVLKKHGCPIITASREADEHLADCVRAQGAYAVLGHDSDFFCMRGIRYIPFAHLVVDDSVPLVSARVFTPDLVAASLGLRVDQLVDLAILCSNDLTALLDQEYDMARKLHFPVQRVQMSTSNTGVYFQPKQAAGWIRQNQLPILEDPTLALIEADKPGFLRALYELYRFYGYSGPFLKRFPMDIEPNLPKNKLHMYRKLLDGCDYPLFAVDVLETKSHRLSHRFDSLMVLSDAGITLSGLLREVRQLAYHALNVLEVDEFDPGSSSESSRVVLKRHVQFSSVYSLDKAPRPRTQVDRSLRSLVFSLLFKSNSDEHASSLYSSLGKSSKSGLAVKTAVLSLLLLWKYDHVYLQSFDVMNDRPMDILLLTSLVCISSTPRVQYREDRPDQRMDTDDELNWELFAAAGCYVETLKQVYQLRVLLGEMAPSGCKTLFSSEVFAPMCSLLTEESVSDGELSKQHVTTVLHRFGSELAMSANDFSEYFHRIRTIMNQMKALIHIANLRESNPENGPIPSTSSVALNESAPSSSSSLREPRLHTTTLFQAAGPLRRRLRDLLATLPVFQHRDVILRNIELNQMTMIQGETGCGKSTAVPQFIYDASRSNGSPSRRPVNVYVTQPRRIAAIELANTVARMREGNGFGEDGVVGNLVGYHIGQTRCVSSNKTRITYVTTGYMVERIIHDPLALRTITHLVLDEVHERSMAMDCLLLLLKLKIHTHPHIRIIFMSATMDVGKITTYFSQVFSTQTINKEPLFVGSKMFPVRDVYLDECVEWFPELAQKCRTSMTFINGKYEQLTSSSVAANSEMAASSVTVIHEKQLGVIIELINCLIQSHDQPNHSQCILVFVPGIMSINMLYESLSMLTRRSGKDRVQLFALHSGLELEHQQEAFKVPDQVCTKIILSTKIAESSVTIPDVTHVINCGIEKQIEMPNAKSKHAEVLMNTWCSRASAKQRAGRAGRVMAGTAFHLFPQKFLERCMAEFSTPEMLRMPLDRTILQLKAKLHQFGKPSMLLNQALDAPDLEHIEGAYNVLAHFDAIDSPEEETAQMTRFGSFVCHFPLDLQLCRLLMTGANLRSSEEPSWVFLLDVVIVSAILAIPDLFIMPSFYHAHSSIEYMKEMKKSLKAKLANDRGLWSEPLAIWRFYLDLLQSRRSVKDLDFQDFLAENSISFRRLQALNSLVSDLCTRFIKLGRNKSEGFTGLLNETAIAMLSELNSYAAFQRAEEDLISYAKQAICDAQEQRLCVLRYLIVHNYEEYIIRGELSKPEEYKDDDLTSMDRVDLQIVKDCEQAFLELSDKQTIELFSQLSSKVIPSVEIAAIACEKGIVSLYSRANKTGVNAEEAFTTSYDRALPRMSFPASLLYYIRDTRFPVSFGLRDENGEADYVFQIRSSSGSSARWSQTKDGARVLMGGRSLFSLPVRPLGNAKKEKPTLLAVYGERVFIKSERQLFCSRLTLLPPDSIGYYPLMMLVCARRNANIWINVDMTTYEIVAVKVDGRSFVFPEGVALHLSALQTINTIREAFTSALNGRSDINKHIHVEDLYLVTDDSAYIVEPSHDGERCFEWKQLYMEELETHTPTIIRGNERMPLRFPELILV